MEVNEFIDSRNSKLADFEKQHVYLKQEYSNALSAAIKDPSPALTARVLHINSELTEALRTILGDLHKGDGTFDTSKIKELNNKLIEYQKDYKDLEQSRDKIAALKIIRNSTAASLDEANIMYYIYFGALVLLCFVIVFLVFRNSIASIVQSVLPQGQLG